LRSHAIHFSLFFEAVLFLLLVVWIRTNRAGRNATSLMRKPRAVIDICRRNA